MFGFLNTALMCGTMLGIAFMVALSLPQSRMRSVVVEICSWAAVVFCGVYAISPIDVVPEVLLGPLGLIDDLGALFLGWQAFRAAKQTRLERQGMEI